MAVLKKPLDLIGLFTNLGKFKINKFCGTIFDVTIPTGANLKGEIEWIDRQLPDRIDSLNRDAGVRVLSFDINKQPNKLFAVISLKLFVPGEIISWEVTDSELAQAIPGVFKKLLALKIIADFKPPFDLERPLFASNFADELKFVSSCHAWRKEDYTTLIAAETREYLASQILSEYNARLVEIWPPDPGSNGQLAIKLVWNLDIRKQKRFDLGMDICRWLMYRNVSTLFHIPARLKKD